MKKFILFIISLLFVSLAFGQFKPHLDQVIKNVGSPHRVDEMRLAPLYPSIPPAPALFGQQPVQYRTLPRLTPPRANTRAIRVQYDGSHPTPIAIWGSTAAEEKETGIEEKVYRHLEALAGYLQIAEPTAEFRITQISEGKNGYHHIHLQQYFRNIRVGNGQLIVHLRHGKAEYVGGRYYPTPSLTNLQPKVSERAAVDGVLAHASRLTKVSPLSDFAQQALRLKTSEAELVIYHPIGQPRSERLAWEITVVPNIYHRQTYYLDAQSGEVLLHYDNVCGFHPNETAIAARTAAPPLVDGPTTGTGVDLSGANRTLNTYVYQNVNYLLDGSRPMFNIQRSKLPWEPVGAIWTVDGLNGSPAGNEDFSIKQVTSTTTVWNNPTAVSAHYNAGKAYEYFATTFGRNSIDGRGGTIISIFNVADEDGGEMDNAFWNGVGIFYGNGRSDFFSLAASLDVAAHEIGHGVTQTSANLEYIGQSGALNEHFSDVFGVMVDRDDWLLGETVVRQSAYPSGALRDMKNPNNGGSRLGHAGWQPAHMNEFQNLPLTPQGDNGGVHINSGIVNRAFVLFAEQVGKANAEQIYYNALVNILTRSSQFIDMRLAIIESCKQLAPNDNRFAQAAAAAFDAVGITGNQGTDTQVELEENQGNEFILFADNDQNALRIYTPADNPVFDPVVTGEIISKPSVTDDGSVVVFVAGDQNIYALLINWNTTRATLQKLTDNGIWRNVAISREGRRLAALTDDLDNRIWVFDLESDRPAKAFELFNPATAEGVTTGDVAYADVLEWDFSGEHLMYDAKTQLNTQAGAVEFWDIGFINVWDNQANDFGNNFISKLFSALPDGISVGNPTFAKNSPYIIAMDVIDEIEESYSILGVNIETGDVGGIFSNLDLGSPNYSVDDRQLLFNAFDQNDNPILGVIDLEADKINSVENTAFILITGAAAKGARSGVWFANGQRNLNTPSEEIVSNEGALKVYPNPLRERFQIELRTTQGGILRFSLFDSFGRLVRQKSETAGIGDQTWEWSTGNLPAGTYWLRIEQDGMRWGQRLVKVR